MNTEKMKPDSTTIYMVFRPYTSASSAVTVEAVDETILV
eukprot:CAMPEP_0116994780 /NCGR_PEP_ID=MMETSP0467-20121206/68348_1 /TAXON_ID=283647 /ORGANISM="Mesodinium pulex, Strain SPMC105" /LENGTH=38 /DNA_ID= /DNA_START= /DNA_END= /DNA_ORIENTATION=